jgi:hypothetical protein
MPGKRNLKRLGRILLLLVILLLGVLLLPLVGVAMSCRPWIEVAPDPVVVPAEIAEAFAGGTRPEDQTYLTLPEWYIVYSADEYATFITEQPPSHFPYFGAIEQYWRSYYDVCGVIQGHYPFNTGYHLTLAVIGGSFTLENLFKGVYEKSIGWATEALSSEALTPEDAFARTVAKAYGNFIHTIPWYEFPFREKLRELWATTPLWGPNPIRKWERKLALSLEYGGKAFYAGLIKQGTQAAYEPEKLEILARVEGISDELLARHAEVRVIQPVDGDSTLVAIPRYEAFTQLVPVLVDEGVRFLEIAGNDDLLITVLAPAAWHYDLPDGQFLFAMPILTEPARQRVAITVPVPALHRVLQGLAEQEVALEHLYDY